MADDAFAKQLEDFRKKVELRMDQAVRKIVIVVGARLVERSPVGDATKWSGPAPKGYTGGRFRANWQYGEGVVPQGVLDAVDKTGAASISRIVSGLGASPAGKVHYITNNLPYAMRLETGWSKQAPAGMVGLTVKEFQPIVAKIAREFS